MNVRPLTEGMVNKGGRNAFPSQVTERPAPPAPSIRRSTQQLVARIKRSSKYYGQTAHNQWFEVRVVSDTHYHLRGNSNNYRLSDVSLGMRLDDGSVVDLVTGKVVAAKTEAA